HAYRSRVPSMEKSSSTSASSRRGESMTDRWLIVALLGCLIPTFGCTKVPAVRFVNAPIVWEVDDRRDVPVKPYERPYYPMARKIGHGYAYHLTDTMSAEPPRRALDVNALGEVPDSTWFTNRI